MVESREKREKGKTKTFGEIRWDSTSLGCGRVATRVIVAADAPWRNAVQIKN